MSFKGKTYSKKGSGGNKTGNPFERMMKEQCNKPVAAKSAGIVGKWGATSFTSVRTNAEQNHGAPKVKKFFKSRTEKSVSSSDEPAVAAVATVAAARIISPPEKQSASKKIFRSKNIPHQVTEPPDPPRSSRSRAPGRSPLQDKDWPPAPAEVTPVPVEEEPIKKLPVPRTRKTRQNQVPDENPEDKASRLLALFNSQSKENHPSEGSKSKVSRLAKPEKISHPQESHKRKASDSLDPDNKLPIPKLKISLKSSARSDDYKVVKHDVNNSESDQSNGWSCDKYHQNIIAQSDLELLEGDFVSEPEPPPAPRTRRRSPLSPPRKQPRNLNDDVAPAPASAPQASSHSSHNETDDMFNLLLQTRPKRGKTKGPEYLGMKKEPVRNKALPLPQSQNNDPFEQIMSVKSSTNSDSVKDLTRDIRHLHQESVPAPDAICDDHRKHPMPQRAPEQPMNPEVPPVSNKSKPAKKTFFKSRNKAMHEEPKSLSPPPAPTVDAFSMDFDRVPPIPNVLEETFLSSQSQDCPKPLVSKSRNKFFKSKNKTSTQSDLSSQNSKSSLDLYPSSQISVKSSLSSTQSLRSTAPSSLLSRETSISSIVTMPSSPPPFRSPSPDTSIQFPARIATPVKTDKPVHPVKKSIFKHKAKESKDAKVLPKKAMSLYKHKMGWGGDKNEFRDREAGQGRDEDNFEGGGSCGADDFDFESEPVMSEMETDISFAPGKLTRVATYPMGSTSLDHDTGELVTQVKCPKSYKEYFTVIKNVKSAHEMNDIGEFQEFNDDVEYICDGMKPRNKISARCLAAISLAQKCMKPNFRMHLRAHGEVSKFFSELKDAPSNSSLALCTSTILFVLSQDRLNMDMDRESLELLLNLLDTDCNIKDAMDDSGMDKRELAKNKQKVIDICTEMKSKGHAGTLNLEMISADHLAMETLLSMTSKRAGEWFKEELRELGGLAHLARTFTDCVSYLTIKDIKSWSDQLVEKLKKANRILRVLENVSHENEENCNYLIQYGRAVEVSEREFVEILQKLFKLLDEEVQLNPTNDMADKEDVGVILRDTLFSVMRVHINLVHDYQNKAYGSLEVGQQEGCMYRVLRCIFIMPYWFCPLSKRFEALVLSLTLLINMVEHSEENRSVKFCNIHNFLF